MSADDKEFKWSDIYFEATKPGASQEAIRIKDHAFHEAQELIGALFNGISHGIVKVP